MKVTHAKYGDRWDLIAYDILGDASMAAELMAANGRLVETDTPIAEGTEIVIPDVYTKENKITKIAAPWRL
ncbi:MAG: tail protein X [Rikenellaceae bacterium]